MSAYIGIGGKTKSVSKMYVGVDGKAHQVQKAYIGVNGVAKLWYQRGTPLGNYDVGNTVKIAVDGKDYDWLVVHQGIPDAGIYDSSCDGTWLLMKDVYRKMKFHYTGNDYKNCLADKYLNGDFYNLIDSGIRSVIKQVKIPYWNGEGDSGSLAVGSDGMETKIFALSCREVGDTSTAVTPDDGSKLDYFISGHSSDAKNKRIAYMSGSATEYGTRTPELNTDIRIYNVEKAGSLYAWYYDSSYGVRPCMILPQYALVDDTGHITGGIDDPRTQLGWLNVGSTVKMDVNGNKRVWRIAYKGNPNPDIYDASCDGVWLVLNTIYSTRANGSDCQYAGGIIDTYLNSTFLGRIDKTGNAAKYIKDIKIPYAKKLEDGSWEVQTKENGLPCKVFLPSIFEIGGAESLSVYKDGSVLGYYDGSPSTLTLKQSGTPAPWRTRTVTSDAQSEFSVDATGTITTCAPTDVIGVVPCVIMRPDAIVENGIIVGE